MRKVGILSFILVIIMTACSSDSVEQERKTQEAIIELERIEHGTRSCIEVTKNANSTPISIMATCQLAMTRYSNARLSSVAELVHNLPDDYQNRFISTMKELESALIIAKALEYEYEGNQYVENVVREQRLAADMIESDAEAVQEANKASQKMDKR